MRSTSVPRFSGCSAPHRGELGYNLTDISDLIGMSHCSIILAPVSGYTLTFVRRTKRGMIEGSGRGYDRTEAPSTSSVDLSVVMQQYDVTWVEILIYTGMATYSERVIC
jgi:hypothetical protein